MYYKNVARAQLKVSRERGICIQSLFWAGVPQLSLTAISVKD